MNTHTQQDSPFHAGEQALQTHIGKRERMEVFGRKMIRDHMPDQHREFYAQLPFLVAGSVDPHGNPWATLLTGQPGFVTSSDAQMLRIEADARTGDPVIDAITDGVPMGFLGIELPTRRRNRVNGRVVSSDDASFHIHVDQAFGNCPQYIQSRSLEWMPGDFSMPKVEAFADLPQSASTLIAHADTFFVASAAPTTDNPATQGVDVSHRGGQPGFVRVQGNTLTIPDFKGNNHFNTLGNFVLNPKAGLVFADFDSGDLLQVTGTVTLLAEDDPQVAAFAGAQRAWQVAVTQGQWLRGALPFRFGQVDYAPRLEHTGTWQTPATPGNG